jgi:hypothetical protein
LFVGLVRLSCAAPPPRVCVARLPRAGLARRVRSNTIARRALRVADSASTRRVEIRTNDWRVCAACDVVART